MCVRVSAMLAHVYGDQRSTPGVMIQKPSPGILRQGLLLAKYKNAHFRGNLGNIILNVEHTFSLTEIKALPGHLGNRQDYQ